MGLFERRIRSDTDLRNVATDRLLREYAKHADAPAALNYINQQTEFSTRENPVTVDADMFVGAVQGLAIRGNIQNELQRRGVTPPD